MNCKSRMRINVGVGMEADDKEVGGITALFYIVQWRQMDVSS